MNLWLMEQDAFDALQEAIKAGAKVDPNQQAEHEARIVGAADGDTSRLLTMGKRKATIAVRGVLTNRPSLFAMLFGGGNTTYTELVQAVAQAEADDGVESIDFEIDSPGGMASADWLTAMDAIHNATKPTRAVVTGMAASAAYGLASQADEVVAVNRMASVGSVGVVAQYFVNDNVVQITSTEAPNKRPDVTTEEGKAAVREQLDALHSEFVGAIARGRGVDPATVNAEYGKGSVLLAADAVERGMIDAIATPVLSVVPSGETASSANTTTPDQECTDMDMNKLKAEHPELHAQCIAEGQRQERERVSAHLTLGKSSGAMDVALAAIEKGDELTAKYHADYLAASMNRKDAQARADDDAAAAAADKLRGQGEDPSADDDDAVSLAIAEGVEARLGISHE